MVILKEHCVRIGKLEEQIVKERIEGGANEKAALIFR